MNFLKKLLGSRWIKPIWKAVLRRIIQQGGDALQHKARKELALWGKRALPRLEALICTNLSGVRGAISSSWAPQWAKEALTGALQNAQEQACKGVKDAEESPMVTETINRVFDTLQLTMLKAVDAL